MTEKQSADEWLAQRIYLLISAASIQPTESELEAFAEEYHCRKQAEQPSFEARCAEVLRGILEEALAVPFEERLMTLAQLVRNRMRQLESEASDE